MRICYNLISEGVSAAKALITKQQESMTNYHTGSVSPTEARSSCSMRVINDQHTRTPTHPFFWSPPSCNRSSAASYAPMSLACLSFHLH